MAKNFVEAVKEMHAKMANVRTPSPQQSGRSSPVDSINLLKKFPQLLVPKTGK